MIPATKVSVVDYIVFGVSLVVPVAIALYNACVKKQKTTNAVFLGDRSLSALPTSFSLAVSYLSAIAFTGIPGEVAYHGWLFPWTWLLASSTSIIIVGNIFIPVFYKMNITSVYEYLELRYNSRTVRLLASFSYIVSMILYLGVVLYAPCLALNKITGLPVVALVLLGGIVATIYTAMGGLKTVVWTDLFQGLIMLTGLGVTIGRGLYLVGGVARVWEVNEATGRIEWANWDPSPFTENTTLGIFCGQFILVGAIFGCHQTQVQRYCSTRSVTQARWSLFLSVVVIWLLVGSAVVAGLVVFANYWSCDPLLTRTISKKDELVTLFVLDHLADFSGIPGIFISSLLCGALSAMSSGLNSLSAIIWEDLVRPMPWSVTISEGRQVFLTRAIAAFMGLVTIGLAVIAANLEGVLQMGNAAIGVLAGPILAVFLLGFFTTTANKYGAIVGILIGDAFTLWLWVGSILKGASREDRPSELPTFAEGCGQNNSSLIDARSLVHGNRSVPEKPFFRIPEGHWDDILYGTSPNLYALAGFLICLIACLFASLLSRLCLRQYRPVEPLLLHPLVRSEEAPRPQRPPPYALGHLQPYYGDSRSRFHADEWEADDTHFRWPSPSLPPTLKKGAKHFGTLDKSDFAYPGKVNYAYASRSSPDGDFDDEDKQTSISSANESEVVLDDFGDVIGKKAAHYKKAGEAEEEDDDGWTTEF